MAVVSGRGAEPRRLSDALEICEGHHAAAKPALMSWTTSPLAGHRDLSVVPCLLCSGQIFLPSSSVHRSTAPRWQNRWWRRSGRSLFQGLPLPGDGWRGCVTLWTEMCFFLPSLKIPWGAFNCSHLLWVLLLSPCQRLSAFTFSYSATSL